jgi:allantoin racemase
MHIRIINPTITKSWEEDTQRIYQGGANPGTQVSVVTLDWGTASIENYRDHALVIPDILNKTLAAERDGVDAVIVDCMGDPGVAAARELVSIPVIGPAEASMHLASILGHRFSVLTVLDSQKPMVEQQVALYGLSNKLASVRAFNIPVLELEKDPATTLKTVINVSVRCVREDGAHVIVPGCTGLAGMAPRIQAGLAEQGCEVPVLDPPPIAMKLAEALVSLGLSHSKRTYATPQTKAYQFPGLNIYR